MTALIWKELNFYKKKLSSIRLLFILGMFIFLALLELLKLQFVKAKQTELFGDIDIYENEEKAVNE